MKQPVVRYLHQALPREEIAALYLAADVMLVTALRDCMSLVAKEYVASRPDEQSALVLSEFTGADDELTAAYLVPHDIQATKDTILQAAFAPPREAKHRMHSLREQIRTHDVRHWASAFLGELSSVESIGTLAPRNTRSLTAPHTPPTPKALCRRTPPTCNE